MSSTEICEVKPVQAFLSTDLNNKNKTFDDVANKIMRFLGWPVVSIELHRDQVYEAIALAVEFFMRYSGYDREVLVFDSKIYERDKGLRIDKLCTIAANKAAYAAGVNPRLLSQTYNKTIDIPERVYVALTDIAGSDLPAKWASTGIKNFEVITAEDYDAITSYNMGLAGSFKISKGPDKTFNGEKIDAGGVDLPNTQPTQFQNAFDYDIMDYRKVKEVISYDESSTRSLTSLFSFESALAAQTYFMYQFQQKGFDLLSYHTLHEFMKTRRRTLALDRTFNFDPYTQYFTLSPQPRDGFNFYGVIQCYVEWPLARVLQEPWIFKYALAQCQYILGSIRGRFGTVQLAGGGSFADNLSYRSDAMQTIEKLEKELIEGTAFSSKTGPLFFVG